MKKIKLLLVFFTCFLGLQTTTNFAFADAKMTDATKILVKKMEEASCIDKLKNVKSMFVKTTMDIPDAKLSGTTEVFSLIDKAYQKATIAGNEQEAGFDGKMAWGKDLMQGTRELKGQERENIIQSTLGVMKNPTAYYTEIIQEKDEKFQEKECFVLIFKKDGIPDRKTYVEKSNHLPLAMIDISDTPQGKMTIKTHFISYKKTDSGFLIPDKMLVDMGIMKLNVVVTEIKVDGEIDEKIFKQPE